MVAGGSEDNGGLEAAAERVATRDDLVEFLRVLAVDLETRREDWENVDLGRFIEALADCVGGVEQRHRNLGLAPPKRTWNLFADLMLCARVHE